MVDYSSPILVPIADTTADVPVLTVPALVNSAPGSPAISSRRVCMVNVFRESLIRFPTKIATHLLRDVTGRTRCVVFSLQIGSERRSPKTYNTFLGTGRTRRVVFSSQIGSDRRSPYDPFDTFLIIHTRRDQLGPRPFVLRAQRPARQEDAAVRNSGVRGWGLGLGLRWQAVAVPPARTPREASTRLPYCAFRVALCEACGWDSGLEVQGLGFEVHGSGLSAYGLGIAWARCRSWLVCAPLKFVLECSCP